MKILFAALALVVASIAAAPVHAAPYPPPHNPCPPPLINYGDYCAYPG